MSENTEQSSVVATLLENAVAETIHALHTIQRVKDLVGTDPKGTGRHVAIAYTHIEDGLARLKLVQEMERLLGS